MQLKDLLDLQEKLETRINAYWTYWSVVVLAIAGWLFSKDNPLSVQHAYAAAIAAAVFFLANLGVLWSATQLVTGVRDEIRLTAKAETFASARLVAALAADSPAVRLALTVGLHLVIDAVVLWSLLTAGR